jgi:hypothetical protein
LQDDPESKNKAGSPSLWDFRFIDSILFFQPFTAANSGMPL